MLAERSLRINPVEKRSTAGVVWGKPVTNSDAATCFHPNPPINTSDPSDDFRANNYAQYSSLARTPTNCNAHVVTSNHPGGAQFALKLPAHSQVGGTAEEVFGKVHGAVFFARCIVKR